MDDAGKRSLVLKKGGAATGWPARWAERRELWIRTRDVEGQGRHTTRHRNKAPTKSTQRHPRKGLVIASCCRMEDSLPRTVGDDVDGVPERARALAGFGTSPASQGMTPGAHLKPSHMEALVTDHVVY